MKISILYSGGLDSLILVHYAKIKYPNAEVIAVFWNHGHNAARAEIERLPDYVQIRNVDWLNLNVPGGYLDKKTEPSGPMYIPGRNMIFAMLTACQDLPDEIWLGALSEEAHELATDKNDKFHRMMTEAASYVLSPWKDKITVRAPFVDEGWTKYTATKWAFENGLTEEEIKSTVSCYNLDNSDRVKKCGNCKQCVRRLLIFGKLGFSELDQMEQNPLIAKDSRQWLIDIVNQLQDEGWKQPLLAETPQYFDFLPNLIRVMCKNDKELLDVADMVDAQFN